MANTVKQISLFLENTAGSLYEAMELLSKADIRIITTTVSDTAEYGILRIITTESERAYDILSQKGKNCVLSEVIAISCDAAAASFYDKLRALASDGVVVDYMYGFSISGSSCLIIKVDDNDKALASIMRNGLKALNSSELNNL